MADLPSHSRKQSLLVLRIIWAALLMGQVVFLVVIMTIRKAHPEQPTFAQTMAYVAMGMLVIAAPTAFTLRKLIYGPLADSGMVSPQKYVLGNIVFLAMLEAVSMFGLVVFLLGVTLGIVVAGIAMGLQAVNFPTGSAMPEDQA